MSITFAWRPEASAPPPAGVISPRLAEMLAEWRALGTLESSGPDILDDLVLGELAETFLEGVRIASSDDEIRAEASALLSAIRQHKAVRICVEGGSTA